MTETDTSILLVEDDTSVRESISEFLEDHGWSTRSAATLGEARRALRDASPFLCLLDLNLPDGNGLDLLREIIRKRLPVRVIVMTAFPLQHLRPKNAEPTLVGWMTKPVMPDQLLDAVRAAM